MNYCPECGWPINCTKCDTSCPICDHGNPYKEGSVDPSKPDKPLPPRRNWCQPWDKNYYEPDVSKYYRKTHGSLG